MAAIKDRNTGPEMVVRRLAHRMGYRFRLHRKDLPGKPDLVFPGRKAIIFVHGCFWHQHSSADCNARPPKSNSEYWNKKLEKNVARDSKQKKALESWGWKVLVIWECETKDAENLQRTLAGFLR